MELINKNIMYKISFFIAILCLFTNCSKDSDNSPQNYSYYYPMDDATIRQNDIGDGTAAFDPRGMVIANNKLYVCNSTGLEVFDALTLQHLKTITDYVKDKTTMKLGALTSVSVDNGRIYLGGDSRLFVLDETTTLGINYVGNGQWWTTFVGVYGVVAKDGFVFVKEQDKSIKVFETTQITETSNWNLTPFAKLNTLQGGREVYTMDVADGKLIVAGRNAKNYLVYNFGTIRSKAEESKTTPLEPDTKPFSDAKPTALSFGTDWAIGTENVGNTNYLRLYPKKDFLNQKYVPILNAGDIMGENAFGSISGVAQLEDRIFLSDNTNKRIRVVKIIKAAVIEQK